MDNNIDAIINKQNRCLEEVGYYIHYVSDVYVKGIDCHTHGLYNFNHKELQITTKILPEKAYKILNRLGMFIKDGNVIEDNTAIDLTIDNDNFSILILECDNMLRIAFENIFEGEYISYSPETNNLTAYNISKSIKKIKIGE